MLGIVPAAGCGSRIQPLGCSKELLPVGSRVVNGAERPKAVSEYLIERMLLAGADRICVVLSPEKSDIFRYYGESPLGQSLFYVLQPQPKGLCDAVFSAIPHLHDDSELVLIGLPDTIWFPADCFRHVPRTNVHLITFPVPDPEHFDAVIPNDHGTVARVEVKQAGPCGRRVWGAITSPARDLHRLHRLWQQLGCKHEYLGHLFNVWIDQGGVVTADTAGTDYLDVGTLEGYHRALAQMHVVERAKAASGITSPPQDERTYAITPADGVA